MKGSRDIIEMEENGDIKFNEATGCYEPINQAWLEGGFFNTSHIDEKKEREDGNN